MTAAGKDQKTWKTLADDMAVAKIDANVKTRNDHEMSLRCASTGDYTVQPFSGGDPHQRSLCRTRLEKIRRDSLQNCERVVTGTTIMRK